VSGKGFKPIGKRVRRPGYREVWRCTTRVVCICQKCGCNWRGRADYNSIHSLNRMSAQSESEWKQPCDEWRRQKPTYSVQEWREPATQHHWSHSMTRVRVRHDIRLENIIASERPWSRTRQPSRLVRQLTVADARKATGTEDISGCCKGGDGRRRSRCCGLSASRCLQVRGNGSCK